MFHRLPFRLLNAIALAVPLASTGLASAKDIFLTIGGGYGCLSNQLSIERNVLYQQSVLADERPDEPLHIVLFADGDDDAPDVQCRDPEFDSNCPPARRMLAELMGDADDMDLYYRNHEIPNVHGPSEASTVRRQLRTLSRQLTAGDRLIIYATGHGGPAEESSYGDYDYEYDEDSQTWKANRQDSSDEEINEFDTSLYFYDGEAVTASEFVEWLDRVPRGVQVVLVMVQCYAGGFSHAIFHQADADLGLSPHARCGFFAQVHDRGAAGCTPNADESEYEEYSSYFWAALAGRSRTGDRLLSADFDENGAVSFAEAHAFAIIESDTIDIPVRTSDAFLRRYSNLGKRSGDDETGSSLGKLFGMLAQRPPEQAGQSLRELEGPIADLAALARPDQRAILRQLPELLELGVNPTVDDVRRALNKVEADAVAVRGQHALAYQRYRRAHSRVNDELLELWPELYSDYAPLAFALANERSDEFMSTVESLASYDAFSRAKQRRNEHEESVNDLARREAKLQRLLHTCESVVLADSC